MLTPDFASMPTALQQVHRWVCHKAKVPFAPAAPRRKASVTDPTTWGTFDQAKAAYEEAGHDGVGVVLDGDGVVGVDLDHVVRNGAPDPAAMALLNRIGCEFIELSPSGTGLHGWGFGPDIGGRRGKLDGINVELYSRGRYLTMTGRPLKDGPLVELSGFTEVADALHSSQENFTNRREQRSTEDDSGHLLCSSVGIPPHTLPTNVGERNKKLFELARWLKGTRPDAPRAELRAIVQEWHRLVLPVIGTKDFATTWGDFLRGWEKVRIPYGATLTAILGGIDSSAPLPDAIVALAYGEKGNDLYRICMALQAHAGAEPFFLSARQAGEMTGMYFTDASKVLSAFVADGVLELVVRGVGRIASRYRLTLPKRNRV